MNELINDGGDCRTAPAKPGLLIRSALQLAFCPKEMSTTEDAIFSGCK